jgi:hypothetical protein
MPPYTPRPRPKWPPYHSRLSIYHKSYTLLLFRKTSFQLYDFLLLYLDPVVNLCDVEIYTYRQLLYQTFIRFERGLFIPSVLK